MKRSKVSTIAPEEWDFSAVPEAELKTCQLWEYARESATIRDLCLRIFEAAGYSRYVPKECKALHAEFNRLFDRLGRASILFQDGIYGFGGTEPAAPNFKTPFPRPWLKLTTVDRQILVATAEWDVQAVADFPAFRRAQTGYARALGRIEPHSTMKEVFGTEKIGVGEFYRSGDKLRQITPHILDNDGKEALVVEIEWGKFTNEQLVKEFARWLKTNEPPGVQRPDGRGRKLNDVRASLDWLGMMRLLHCFTAGEGPQKVPDTKRRFGSRDWYRERQRAGKVFRELFGYLPVGEQPLSWKTKAGQRK